MEIVRAKNDQKIQWPNAFLFLLHGSRRHAANYQSGPNSEAGSYRGKHEKFLHQPANSTGV